VFVGGLYTEYDILCQERFLLFFEITFAKQLFRVMVTSDGLSMPETKDGKSWALISLVAYELRIVGPLGRAKFVSGSLAKLRFLDYSSCVERKWIALEPRYVYCMQSCGVGWP
jgi:hypothetical protein